MDTATLLPLLPPSRPSPPELAGSAPASLSRQVLIRAVPGGVRPAGRPGHGAIVALSGPQVGPPEADSAWADPLPALQAWLVDEVDLDPAQARRWLEQLATIPAPDACPAIGPTTFAHPAFHSRTDLP